MMIVLVATAGYWMLAASLWHGQHLANPRECEMLACQDLNLSEFTVNNMVTIAT